MRRFAQWTLVVVLALDAAFAVALFWGVPTPTSANPATPDAAGVIETSKKEGDEPQPTGEALRLLGRQLAARAAELDRREAELAELLRGEAVLREAGIDPTPVAPDATARATTAAGSSEAFRTLQRAYENMEPETAARALSALAARDSEAVVQLLLGWAPRTSGAILDALATTNPELAADLSYKIWKLGPDAGGKDVPPRQEPAARAAG
jgi:flagellar motility protein MotE (MotC chaperone)